MKTYKYDTHVHTSETSPCGKVPGAKAARLYHDAGYRGVVITDHYYREYFEALRACAWEDKIEKWLRGYRSSREQGEKLGLDVLMGMEIRFDENANDYLVYGIDEAFLKKNKELYTMGIKNFKQLASGNGLLVFQAHPFRKGMVPEKPANIDGIEVYNGNPRHDSANPTALEYARSHSLKELSGSDFHQVQDLARGGIVLSEAPGSSSELADILKSNRVLELLAT